MPAAPEGGETLKHVPPYSGTLTKKRLRLNVMENDVYSIGIPSTFSWITGLCAKDGNMQRFGSGYVKVFPS